MGTPDFAVPALERLAAFEGVDVALVVTQPDRPSGRGKRMTSPAVKEAADRLQLPVLQTGTLRDPEIRQPIVDIEPDLVVVAAFGMILGKWILELPRHGCVNLHASLLPKYRGANPIAAAIAEGESETGVSLMRMDRGLDTGPVYAMDSLIIRNTDTTEDLTPRLADLAGDLLIRNMPSLLEDELKAEPQAEGATLTRPMKKDDGWIDFTRSAVEIERHVRAMWPWPRAWTMAADGSRIQIHAATVVDDAGRAPGQVGRDGKRVTVGTGDGGLALDRVQLPGGKPIEGNTIAQHPVFIEAGVIGASGAPEGLTPLVVPVEEPGS